VVLNWQPVTEDKKERNKEPMSNVIERSSMAPSLHLFSALLGEWEMLQQPLVASMIATKQEPPYSAVTGWLRCRITVSLIWSAITCLRGSRSSKHNVPCGQPGSVNLVLHEGRVLHGTNCFISVCISDILPWYPFVFSISVWLPSSLLPCTCIV